MTWQFHQEARSCFSRYGLTESKYKLQQKHLQYMILPDILRSKDGPAPLSHFDASGYLDIYNDPAMQGFEDRIESCVRELVKVLLYKRCSRTCLSRFLAPPPRCRVSLLTHLVSSPGHWQY